MLFKKRFEQMKKEIKEEIMAEILKELQSSDGPNEFKEQVHESSETQDKALGGMQTENSENSSDLQATESPNIEKTGDTATKTTVTNDEASEGDTNHESGVQEPLEGTSEADPGEKEGSETQNSAETENTENNEENVSTEKKLEVPINN